VAYGESALSQELITAVPAHSKPRENADGAGTGIALVWTRQLEVLDGGRG